MGAEGEGFAQFVEARQRALQRTAWLLTGDWALAEDLVQTALVRSLTARQRAVLVLRVFDDLPEAQVAQVLDCAVGTVKSTLAHALAKLREDPALAGLMDRETQRTGWTGTCGTCWRPPWASRRAG